MCTRLSMSDNSVWGSGRANRRKVNSVHLLDFPWSTLRPHQNGQYFADDIFKCIYWNGNDCMLLNIPFNFVHMGSFDTYWALFQVMTCHQTDKPLPKPMLIKITDATWHQGFSQKFIKFLRFGLLFDRYFRAINHKILGLNLFGWLKPCMATLGHKWQLVDTNSSNAGDRIFWFWGSIPCLLMPWRLKSPGHQQAWYWLCRTNNMLMLFQS